MGIKTSRTLIIPAAGTASRMRGLPKFLLPTNSPNVSLIERHLLHLRNYFDEILIGVNPDFSKLIRTVLPEDEKLKIHNISTQTMMETVLKLSELSESDNFVLIMPDTFFSKYGSLLQFLDLDFHEEAVLICWKIQEFQFGKLGQVKLDENNKIVDIQDKNLNCDYNLFWGATSFTRDHLQSARKSDPHIGYLFQRLIEQDTGVLGVEVDGDYLDCGTQDEYIRMLLNFRN
jgi:NDP-sugar pyrophosphorylase family protein